MKKEEIKEKAKQFYEDVTRKAGWFYWDAKKWVRDNKEIVIIAAPIALGVCKELMKVTVKNKQLKEEQRLKDRYIYDRSNMHYYELRRDLTTREWLEIEERKRRGESLGWILNDMRVLK